MVSFFMHEGAYHRRKGAGGQRNKSHLALEGAGRRAPLRLEGGQGQHAADAAEAVQAAAVAEPARGGAAAQAPSRGAVKVLLVCAWSVVRLRAVRLPS